MPSWPPWRFQNDAALIAVDQDLKRLMRPSKKLTILSPYFKAKR